VPESWDTTSVADGAYDLRVVVTDVAGNSTASATMQQWMNSPGHRDNILNA
jgi:uncharacterized protein YkwD